MDDGWEWTNGSFRLFRLFRLNCGRASFSSEEEGAPVEDEPESKEEVMVGVG